MEEISEEPKPEAEGISRECRIRAEKLQEIIAVQKKHFYRHWLCFFRV